LSKSDQLKLRVLRELLRQDDVSMSHLARRLRSDYRAVERACLFWEAIGFVFITEHRGDGSRVRYIGCVPEAKEEAARVFDRVESVAISIPDLPRRARPASRS